MNKKIFSIIFLIIIFSFNFQSKNFLEEIEIEVYSIPPNGGILNGAGKYPKGSFIKIEAIPKEGYSFKYWISNIESFNESTINPLYFYCFNNSIFIAVFEENKESIISIIVKTNVTEFPILYNMNAKKGEALNISIPKILNKTSFERYVFIHWMENINNKENRITIFPYENLSLNACYLKEIKFIDNEWHIEKDFLNFSENSLMITSNERIKLKAIKINCLNKTIDNLKDLKIPKKYLLNIEIICIKQYLLKFSIEKIKNPFKKIIINNEYIPIESLNNVSEIWIDEGSNVEIFLKENIDNYKLLNESHIMILKMLKPENFKINYEMKNNSFLEKISFFFYDYGIIILVFSLILLFLFLKKEKSRIKKMLN